MTSKDSKTNFALLRDKILGQSGKQYWRSVEEFVDAPEFEEFVKEEYPAHAEEWDSSLSRRNFVKVMGASLAFAGLSGCVIQPAEKIVPYVRQPEGLIPGKPLFYATAMTLGGIATGLLARSYEGRPTKVEGNPEHPGSLGSTDVLAQASILTMYDPDRSKEFIFRGTPRTWQSFMETVRSAVDENRADGGAGVRFLTETITSPTLNEQFKQLFTELPNAKLYQYEPVNNDNAMAGAKMAFGSPAHTVYQFDKADRILSLDADIFSGFNVRYIKDFAKGRAYSKDKKNINRLYSVETTMTLTGAKADHRLAVKPSQMPEVAKAIAAAMGVSGASSTYSENANWIGEMAKDLLANKGKSIVVAGDNQPPMVHALAHAMNAALGNVGQTVTYTEPLQPNADKTQIEQLGELIKEIDGGAVKMLVILGGNPVYNTPVDLKLTKERLVKIPLRVHLGMYEDETAALCQWHLSEKHFLETWSDTRAYDGTVSIVQPLVEPLYGSKSAHEVVQVFFKENYDKKDYDIVQEYWQKQGFATAPKVLATTANATQNSTSTNSEAQTQATPQATPSATPTPNATPEATPTPQTSPTPQNNTAATATTSEATTFEEKWRKAIHDGIIPNSAVATKSVSVNTGFMSQAESAPATAGDLEISILPDPSVYDGRFTNNGWLQELPNPLTKITWDNVALVSPNTAKRLGINQSIDPEEYVGGEQGTTFYNTKGGNLFSDLVTLKYKENSVDNVPMWIAPGQPDDVVTIYMGYGRTRGGRVASKSDGTPRGYDAFAVRTSDAMWSGTGSVAKSGEQTQIASTQIHFNMEGRDLALFYDVEEFEKHPNVHLQHDEKNKSLYSPPEYQKQYDENHRWAMSIDLNSCVGCNACVIACQSENNIPVVGKEQVERSREMHWMRIDAYYTGDDLNNPQGPYFQPVLCQQCEQAPCETVCPVHATVHSAEGLNDMVYNRCVGTRYCSNNCPYKVRRFNFLLYQDWNTPQYKLMRNPEVSIRSRGVMEKCTYCVQRIAAARIEAEKDRREIRDGEILTACQSACPADAIVFGDLNNKESQVAKAKEDHRNYNLLNELNTQPRTTYLTGLKNQNKAMPDYKPLKIEPEKLKAEKEGGSEPAENTEH
jgi:molybdopterin-containing oxidoreductase family iron-sulfur binding subunit